MSLYQKVASEFLSTTFLVLFGNSSVANELLPRTKSSLSLGFGFISLCWGIGASIAIICFGNISASMNPAMSLADYILGRITTKELILFSIAQYCGGFFGSILVYVNFYLQYQIDCIPETLADVKVDRDSLGKTNVDIYTAEGTVKSTEDSPDIQSFMDECALQQSYRLMTFCTKPAVANSYINFISELMGTVMLVIGVNMISDRLGNRSQTPNYAQGLTPLIIGLYIFILIATVGGTTGFACNPARDLGPRIAHFLLPINGKGSSEFRYGISVVLLSNLVGGILGAIIVKEILISL